jgi:hypothetical protein
MIWLFLVPFSFLEVIPSGITQRYFHSATIIFFKMHHLLELLFILCLLDSFFTPPFLLLDDEFCPNYNFNLWCVLSSSITPQNRLHQIFNLRVTLPTFCFPFVYSDEATFADNASSSSLQQNHKRR